MSKTLLVAAREYRASVRSKAFLISVIAMPVLMGGAIALQFVLKDKVDTTDKRIAVLDHSQQLSGSVFAAAELYNQTQVFKVSDGQQRKIKPGIIIERVTASTMGKVKAKLQQRVRDKELFAFVEIGYDKTLDNYAIVYYSNTPTYDVLHKWLTVVLNKAIQIRRLRVVKNDITEAQLLKVTQPVEVKNEDLEGQTVDLGASFLLPMGLMMLIFLAVMVGATPLMQTVLEEKMMRISEVLLGSLRPFQLMFGKLMGTVGVSLTIVTVYLVGAFIALKVAGYESFFPSVNLLIWFFLYLVLAVFMFGALFSAVGAAVTDMREAQSAMMPVMVIAMVPMFVWFNVVKEPNSNLSVAMSLFPPATPMLMVMRQSVPPGIPLWQPILGIVLVLLTSIACIFAAGRIFRIGILMQGKGASFRQIIRWVFRG